MLGTPWAPTYAIPGLGVVLGAGLALRNVSPVASPQRLSRFLQAPYSQHTEPHKSVEWGFLPSSKEGTDSDSSSDFLSECYEEQVVPEKPPSMPAPGKMDTQAKGPSAEAQDGTKGTMVHHRKMVHSGVAVLTVFIAGLPGLAGAVLCPVLRLGPRVRAQRGGR